MTGRLVRAAVLGCVLTATSATAACSGTEAGKTPTNSVRDNLERSLAALPAGEPLRIRYNPTTCDCPLFEVRVAGRWLRASWANATAGEWPPLLAKLNRSAPASWPIYIMVEATVDRELVRTAQGEYATRFEVRKVVADPTQPQSPRKNRPAADPGQGATPLSNQPTATGRPNS